MSRTYLKGPNHLDDLINLIEQDKSKNVEILVKTYPEVIYKKCLNGNQPIFYAIKNNSNKIFKILLDAYLSNENFPEIFEAIIKEGTSKMLSHFIKKSKMDLRNEIYKPYIEQMFLNVKFKFLLLIQRNEFQEFLLFETNLPYCFSISFTSFDFLCCNCYYENIDNGYKKRIFINKDENTKEIYDLDKYTQNENFCRLDYIFSKYQKLFLVLKKSNQRIMEENTIKDIVKFIQKYLYIK